MPPKGWKKVQSETIEGEILMHKEIRHVIAYLSKSNQTRADQSVFSAADLNMFVNKEFLENGYQLFHVERIDANEQGVGLLYVFVR